MNQQIVTFIGKHHSNKAYATIDLLWVSITDSVGDEKIFYFWKNSNESRTRFMPKALNFNSALASAMELTDTIFCGWVTSGIPFPEFVNKTSPDGVAI